MNRPYTTSIETLEKRILKADPQSDGCTALVNEYIKLLIRQKQEQSGEMLEK